MNHAIEVWLLNISLTLLVLLAVALALRAIIKQRRRKTQAGCLGCPYGGTCNQPIDSCADLKKE